LWMGRTRDGSMRGRGGDKTASEDENRQGLQGLWKTGKRERVAVV